MTEYDKAEIAKIAERCLCQWSQSIGIGMMCFRCEGPLGIKRAEELYQRRLEKERE